MKTETSINLLRFCANSDDERNHLRQPWPHQGWMYASNGHIIVRVPAPEHADTVCEHSIATSAVRMFSSCKVGDHAPLPKFTLGDECGICLGKSYLYTAKCDECDDGEFRHGSHDYSCMECDGTGRVAATKAMGGERTPCYGCHGMGYHFKRIAIGDKGAGFQAVYLSWIRALPHATFATGEPDKAGHFNFDGGEGMVMPCKGDF